MVQQAIAQGYQVLLAIIDAKSKEGMEMLAERNENIKAAYEILQRVSKSKEVRIAYESRQAEIMDQLTREKTAKEQGIKEGIKEGIIKTAKQLLIMDPRAIVKATGLSEEEVEMLRKSLH